MKHVCNGTPYEDGDLRVFIGQTEVLQPSDRYSNAELFYMLTFAAPNGANSRHVAASMDRTIDEFVLELDYSKDRTMPLQNLLVNIVDKSDLTAAQQDSWNMLHTIYARCKKILADKAEH